MPVRLIITALFCFGASVAYVTAQTPGTDELNRAYHALASKDYDDAIDLFRKGLAQQPENAGAHKDLAYTLLKTGENADARDEFAAAANLNPQDDGASLEFAFLAYETKQPIQIGRASCRERV